MSENTPPANESQPTHGIIVVDTSAIITMSGLLPERFLAEQGGQQKEEVRLTDVLIELSRMGYQVIIPEMVAFECGGFMRDGNSTNDYFSTENTYYDHCKDFFEKIKNLQQQETGEHNIRIVPPHNMGEDAALDATESDTSKAVAEYMRSYWETHTADLHDETKRILFIHLHKKDTSQFGDVAAQEWARRIPPPSVPVFYLSNDRNARDAVSTIGTTRGIEINRLNVWGFFNALKQEGLLSSFGISADTDFAEIKESLNFSKGVQSTFYEPLDIVPGGTNVARMTQPPFQKSLAGLRITPDAGPVNTKTSAPKTGTEWLQRRTKVDGTGTPPAL